MTMLFEYLEISQKCHPTEICWSCFDITEIIWFRIVRSREASVNRIGDFILSCSSLLGLYIFENEQTYSQSVFTFE